MTKVITVVLADKRPLNLDGLAALVNSSGDVTVAGAAHDGAEAVSLARGTHPSVLVIDAELASRVPSEDIARLAPAKLLLVSDIARPSRMPAGTKGVVLRSSSGATLLEAIRTVANGGTWEMPTHPGRRGRGQSLSPREDDIVAFIAQGVSNREIAQRLGLSEQSVKNLVSRILKKRGYTNRVQIALERWSGG